ncbi:di/tricarboxylate transporter [Salsuginibacillus halophilus]|uniref:Di/tricarboxylate transporter n=1 Tax=Salsuginibacillus halophilus TaxID=517424 RepID=A0A2P8H9Q5_9BACI|nr:SLC13 family permease [Salsuginibacillus halophilus]PSL42952.1 di/tricarboxylate transporter [Salsuginibacillus halophilus]
MTFEIGLVLMIIVIMLGCLIAEISRPEIILFATLAVLLFIGVLNPEEALQGFSNEGMLTVGMLFLVAGAVQQSGLLNRMILYAVGSSRKSSNFLPRMMIPVAGMSAFLNNTPIVVMFTPVVRRWCEKRGIAPSKLLIPLSYAAIFGGSLTLIGTSTNLVIHGFMLDQGMDGFTMFQLAFVGLPAGLLGILYMTTIGYRMLPERKSSSESFQESSKSYLSEAVIEPQSPVAGKTVAQAGFRSLQHMYLIELIREGQRTAPVSGETRLQSNDRLIFTGSFTTIVDLENMNGLHVKTGTDIELADLQNGSAALYEAVISHRSSLIQKTVKESCFRANYGAGVVAIHRDEETMQQKIGEVKLKAGDTILLLAPPDFFQRWANTKDFYLISPVSKPDISKNSRPILSLTTLCAMVTLAAFQVLSMFEAAVLAVLVLLLAGTLTIERVRRWVQFDVLLLIACAIGIGKALEQSGTAVFLAEHFTAASSIFGVTGALIVIYLVTSIFTEVITNNAAAVLMFPIAVEIAVRLDQDPFGFLVAVAIAASASFMTPIGYQTNLIVYGPGGYRFSDYFKVGLPLNAIYLISTVTVVSTLWIE